MDEPGHRSQQSDEWNVVSSEFVEMMILNGKNVLGGFKGRGEVGRWVVLLNQSSCLTPTSLFMMRIFSSGQTSACQPLLVLRAHGNNDPKQCGDKSPMSTQTTLSPTHLKAGATKLALPTKKVNSARASTIQRIQQNDESTRKEVRRSMTRVIVGECTEKR